MMIRVKNGTTAYGKSSGRNPHKKGGNPDSDPITKLSENFESNMQINDLLNHHEQQVPYHYAEHSYQEALSKEADKIRTYSIKKFVEVVEATTGEQYIGYENWKNMVYYYRPTCMIFVAMHTAVCDCKMCTTVRTPIQTSPRHVPYGRRTPNAHRRPGNNPAPTLTKKWTPPPAQHHYSPRAPSMSPLRWTDYPKACDWNSDPFNPEVTRDWDKPAPREERSAAVWNLMGKEILGRIAKMDLIRLRICPTLPKYAGNRKTMSAERAYHQVKRAEEILNQAFNGTINYGSAHREWILYKGECEHGNTFHHAEADCPSCVHVEQELNSTYQEGWTHVKQESSL
jgi:hypothetical protein